MIGFLPPRREHLHRLLRMQQDRHFQEDRLRQFVAPFAPTVMVVAGGMIALTIAVEWLGQGASAEPLLWSILAVCGVTGMLAAALRWAAISLHAWTACIIGCVQVGTLSSVVTLAFTHGSGEPTGMLAYVAVLAIAPVVFWIRLSHYVLGFLAAFAPAIVALIATDASTIAWTRVAMLILFTAFVGLLGMVVISASLYIIYEQNYALSTVSQEDDLTGLLRRRHWTELALRRLSRSELFGEPATLLYIDLDRFKQINDTYGHNVGDGVLQRAAAALVSVLPPEALIARPGGDEFMALLPGIPLARARSIAQQSQDRLRRAGAPVSTLAASIGIAAWTPGESLAELVDRADQAMLRDKAERRRADSLREPAMRRHPTLDAV